MNNFINWRYSLDTLQRFWRDVCLKSYMKNKQIHQHIYYKEHQTILSDPILPNSRTNQNISHEINYPEYLNIIDGNICEKNKIDFKIDDSINSNNNIISMNCLQLINKSKNMKINFKRR